MNLECLLYLTNHLHLAFPFADMTILFEIYQINVKPNLNPKKIFNCGLEKLILDGN